MRAIKAKVFDILDSSEQNGIVERLFNLLIILLIILNVAAVVIEPSISQPTLLNALRIFEYISIIIFSIEYLLRVWVSDMWYHDKGKLAARLIFILTPMALIDLIAILPFYAPFIFQVDLRILRILRVFRLFRILKINRYTNALTSLAKDI